MSKSGIVPTAAVIRPAPLPAAVRAGLCALALSAGWVAPAPVLAGQAALAAEREYRIAPGPLAAALQQLASDADVLLSFDPALVAGRHSQGLSGRFRVGEGFSRLLAGTGLELVARAEGGYTLRRAERGADGAQVLEQVVVTDRADRDGDFAAATAAGEQITREQLDRFPPTSTGDMFRDIAGVTVANNRNGPSLSLNIRGMQGFGRVKLLVDGTSQSSSDHRGYGGQQEHSYVDPALLGGDVTVEKGPGSGPYGAGVVGGVVSMRTLEGDDLIREGRNYGVRLRAGGASNVSGQTDKAPDGKDIPGHTRNGLAAAAWRPWEALELVIAHSAREQGNYKAGSRGDAVNPRNSGFPRISPYAPGAEVHNTSEVTESNLLKAKLNMPQDQTLRLGFVDYDSEYGNVRVLLNNIAGYAVQQALSNTRKKTYTAQYAWQPAGSALFDLRANVWRVETEEFRATNPMVAFSDTTGMELWNTSRFHAGFAGDLSLRYGATWLNDKTNVTDLGYAYNDPDGKRQMSSQFVQAELRPAGWLLLNGGVRRESYALTGSGSYVSGVPGQSPVRLVLDHQESRVNPDLGLTLEPLSGLRFFARYSEGWRPPTAKESIMAITSTFSVSRELLKPELTKNTELGVSLERASMLRPDDAFQARLAWFENRSTNYISGMLGNFYNIGGANLRGHELTLGYDAGWAFARYNLTRYDNVRLCDNDGQPGCSSVEVRSAFSSVGGIYLPPRKAESATLGLRLLDRSLTVGARMTSASDRAMKAVSITGGTPAYPRDAWAPYGVWDAFATWRVGGHLTAGLSVENLRDRFYIDASTAAMPLPSPGRTTKLSLTYDF